MKTNITKCLIDSVDTVLSTAIRNVCTCDGKEKVKRGYLGHSVDCWVHIGREDYRRVGRFVGYNRRLLNLGQRERRKAVSRLAGGPPRKPGRARGADPGH